MGHRDSIENGGREGMEEGARAILCGDYERK